MHKEILNSLIARTYVDIFLVILLFVILFSAIWLLPFLEDKLNKKRKKKVTEKKRREQERSKKKRLSGQVILSLISVAFLVVFSIVVIIPQYEDMGNMKKDIYENSFVTYSGEYYLCNNYGRSDFTDFFLDLRGVEIEGRDELLWLDMAKTYEGFLQDWGECSGEIVYGKHSGYIVEINLKIE